MRECVGTSVRIGAALLGMLLAAGGLPVGTVRADVAPSVMIVAGQSIGPVRLGMAAADVPSVLGDAVLAEGGHVQSSRLGITAKVEDGAVVRVSTTNPQFRTSRGAGVGISLDDSVRLIGDSNTTVSAAGNDTTLVYPFQGIGFVFRDGRAMEVFVVQAIARAPSPPLPVATPDLPPGDEAAQATPPADTVASDAADVAAQAALSSGPSLEARDLAETVDADRGILHITGRVVKTSPQALGTVTVSVQVFRAGESAEGETGATAPPMVLSSGEARFTLDVSVARAVVVQYAVQAVTFRAGNTNRLVLARRTVPRDAYADLARARTQVSVALGAPSNTGPRVQVLVTIAGTGPIPPDWVRGVQVEIPFSGGAATVTLTPGQTQTIFVPSVARVGEPRVQRVDLNAS